MLLVTVNGSAPVVVQREDELDAWTCATSHLPLAPPAAGHARRATVSGPAHIACWFDCDSKATSSATCATAAILCKSPSVRLRLKLGAAEWQWAVATWGTAAKATVALPLPLRALSSMACRTVPADRTIELALDVASHAAAVAWVSSFLIARIRHATTGVTQPITVVGVAFSPLHQGFVSASSLQQDWLDVVPSSQPAVVKQQDSALTGAVPQSPSPLLAVRLVTDLPPAASQDAKTVEGEETTAAPAAKPHKRGKRGGKHRNLQAKAARAAALANDEAAPSQQQPAVAEGGSDSDSECVQRVAPITEGAVPSLPPSPRPETTTPTGSAPQSSQACVSPSVLHASSLTSLHAAFYPYAGGVASLSPSLRHATLSPSPQSVATDTTSTLTSCHQRYPSSGTLSWQACHAATTPLWQQQQHQQPAYCVATGYAGSEAPVLSPCVATPGDYTGSGMATYPSVTSPTVATESARNGAAPGHRKRISQLALAFAAAAADSCSVQPPSPSYAEHRV